MAKIYGGNAEEGADVVGIGEGDHVGADIADVEARDAEFGEKPLGECGSEKWAQLVLESGTESGTSRGKDINCLCVSEFFVFGWGTADCD
jgi:hypothetical protein